MRWRRAPCTDGGATRAATACPTHLLAGPPSRGLPLRGAPPRTKEGWRVQRLAPSASYPPPPPQPAHPERRGRGRGQSQQLRRHCAGAMAPTSHCPAPPTPPSQLNLWVVPDAGRNPPILVGRALCRAEPSRKGAGAPATPPGMGSVAPLVERFEAMPPFRGQFGTVLCTSCRKWKWCVN